MPSKVPSILVGAAVATILGIVVQFVNTGPAVGNQVLGGIMGCIACLAYAIAGVIAVYHYTNTHGLTISPGSGAGLGALAGVAGALIGYLIGLLLQTVGVFPSAEELMQMQMEMMRDQGMTEDQIEAVEQFAGFSQGPIAVAIAVVFGAILGAIGGAIGAAMFKKGGDPMLVDDTI